MIYNNIKDNDMFISTKTDIKYTWKRQYIKCN